MYLSSVWLPEFGSRVLEASDEDDLDPRKLQPAPVWCHKAPFASRSTRQLEVLDLLLCFGELTDDFGEHAPAHLVRKFHRHR